MKRILVATDGSQHSNHAVRKAAELARLADAELIIVHVQDDRRIGDLERQFLQTEYYRSHPSRLLRSMAQSDALRELEWSDAISLIDDQSNSIRQIQSERILDVARRVAEEAGVPTPTTLSVNGDAAQSIIGTAKENNVDLVVVGRRGLGAVSELLLGSVSQKVLHHADTDVMTVA